MNLGRDPNIGYESAFLKSKRAMIVFLREVFAGDTMDEAHRFKPDDLENSPILIIDDREKSRNDVIGQRLVISVERNPISWLSSTGMDKLVSGPDPRNNDRKVHADMVRFGLTIKCFSPSDQEAEELANHVFMSVQSFRDVLRLVMGLTRIESVSMGQAIDVVRGESNRISIMVPVSIQGVITESWAIEPSNSRRLAGIIIEHLAHYDRNADRESKIITEIANFKV